MSAMGPRVVAALFAQTLISAVTYLAARRALLELSPLNLVLLRLVLAAILFVGVLVALGRPLLPARREWPLVAGFGVLAGPVNQSLFLYGLSRSTPAHAALLYAMTPIGVFLLGVSGGREHFSGRRLLGLALAFGGVLVLLFGRGLSFGAGTLVGDLCILGAVAAWAVYTAQGRRITDPHGPIQGTAWVLIASALCSLPFAPLVFEPSEVADASLAALLSLAFLVVITTVVNYLLWYYALSRAEASQVAVFMNLQPVATALLARAVLGDSLTWEVFVGGALVLLGVRFTRGG